MLRSPTKLVANIPPGVGADSSRPCPDIIKYTYSHNQICVFKSPHMHFRLPFRGCIHIRGHDKSAPTAACGLPFRCERIAKTLLTDCDNATNTHEIHNKHPRNTQQTPTKYTTNTHEIRNEHPRNAQRTLSILWVNNSLQTCCCVMFVCLQVL